MGATPAAPSPISIRGRLSYPLFSYDEAVANNQSGMYPTADKSKIKASYNLLLEQQQLDKVVASIRQFLPHAVANMGTLKVKDRPRNGLTQAEADKIEAILDSGDWADQPPYLPIKPLSEKSAELAPECVASLKIVATPGKDIVLKAKVTSDAELDVPDPDLIIPEKGVILPIARTLHELYAGCQAMTQIHFYSYAAGPNPGINASSGACVFRMDDTPFSAGSAIDEDALLDDDE
jgi:hypothetical protein